jgi:hypothetical protein
VPRLPPLYPLILRVTSPRTVNAIAFGVTIASVTMLAGIPAGVFALTSTDLVLVHAMAWSEAPFIALMVGFLWSLSRGQTIAAGTLGAVMSVTRLAGVAAIPTILIVTWRQNRPRRALLAAATASIPFLAFAAMTLGAGRSFAWHPPDGVAWTSAALALMGWVAPASAPPALFVIGPLAAVAIAIRAWQLRASSPPIVRVASVWCAAYLAVVMLARTFVDALVPFDGRMLAPLLVGALIAVSAATLQERPRYGTGALVATCLVVWAAVRGADALSMAQRAGREGLGFASRAWMQSSLAREVRQLPANAVIFSNAADGLAYATRRTVRFIPSVRDPLTRRPVADSATVAVHFIALVEQQNAYVVYARDVARWRQYVLPESTFSRALRRPPRTESDSGAVYR